MQNFKEPERRTLPEILDNNERYFEKKKSLLGLHVCFYLTRISTQCSYILKGVGLLHFLMLGLTSSSV